jgi:hypothetical protein
MRYCGVACGQFPFFLHPQDADRALPGEGPVRGAARQHDPRDFPNVRTGPAPFCTSDPHGCAQQSLQHVLLPGRQAAACRCLRDTTGTQDADPAGAWMTSPTTAGTGCSPHPCRTGGPRTQVPACCHAHRDPAGRASSIRSSCPGSVAASAGPPGLRHRGHEPEREAPVPIDDQVQQLITVRQRPTPWALTPQRPLCSRRRGTQSCGLALRRSCTGLLPARRLPRSLPPARRGRPRTSPCSAGPPIIAAGIPAPGGVPTLAKTFLPGRIRHGPSMYEMEGPCPASPRRLASCLVFAARRALPAGARYPREAPVSRLLPRSRRRPRVVPVSSGESISTTAASTAQGPAASHFLFFRYPRRNPQKAGSYPHFTAVIHGFTHSLPTGYGCKPENT